LVVSVKAGCSGSPGEYRCDRPDDHPFFDQWFSISPARENKFLDKARWLVDAGDHDSDGKSELVFSMDDDSREGSKLFYNTSIRKPSSSSAKIKPRLSSPASSLQDAPPASSPMNALRTE